MPKVAMNYENTCIYKIYCKDSEKNLTYVGHTTNFRNRKYQHKSNAKNTDNWFGNFKLYKIIRENGGWDNFEMEELECFSCKCHEEACKREREWFEKLNATMNDKKPHVSSEELVQYHKEWRDRNREQINAKYVCNCGGRYVWNHRSHHINTKRHKEYVKLESEKK